MNQNARGAAGEIGVFQLMPGTASDLGVDPYSLDGTFPWPWKNGASTNCPVAEADKDAAP